MRYGIATEPEIATVSMMSIAIPDIEILKVRSLRG